MDKETNLQINPGVFIVLEGSDGSGKGTQFKLLSERLRAMGYDIEVFDFPRYNEPSSHFAKSYLNGKYGPASEISPYTASLFFALDRFEAAPQIRRALKEGKIVLANRYVGSNMAHQGSKFTNPGEQRGFFIWADSLEYGLLSLPRPTVSLFLRVPADISFKLIGQKNKRGYTENTHDEHEADLEHLKKSVETYDVLSRLFPKDFKPVESTSSGKLLSIPAVNERIWDIIKPLLPPKPDHPGHPAVFKLDELVSKPAEIVMTTEEQPQSVQSGLDMAVNLKNTSLLAANSIREVPGINLSEKFDLADGRINPSFYSISGLPKKISANYKEILQQIIDGRIELKKKLLNYLQTHEPKLTKSELGSLVADILLRVTPLATLVDIKIEAKPADIKKLIKILLASEPGELRWLGAQITEAAARIHPSDFKEEKNALKEAVHADTTSLLRRAYSGDSAYSSSDQDDVQLLNALPRNEFELLAESIYSYSSSPKSQLTTEIESWPYEKKLTTLHAALSSNEILLEQIRYEWDVVEDHLTIEKLYSSGLISELRSQAPTPRFGYEVPELVEKAGAEDLFLDSFDKSLELFSSFQRSGAEGLSGYATLIGHKNRRQFVVNAGQFAELIASLPDQNLQPLLETMKEQIGLIHPITTDFILKNKLGGERAEKTDPKVEKNSKTPASRARGSKKSSK